MQRGGYRRNITQRGTSPLAQLLQGPTAAHDEIIPQHLQLLPAPEDPSHPLHVVVEALVDQLQVDQRLVTDLAEELESLLANLGQREARGGHAPRSSPGGSEEGLRWTSPPLLLVETFRGTFRKRRQMQEHFPALCTDRAQTHPSLCQVPVVDEA